MLNLKLLSLDGGDHDDDLSVILASDPDFTLHCRFITRSGLAEYHLDGDVPLALLILYVNMLERDGLGSDGGQSGAAQVTLKVAAVEI